jgi:hypothetical protein
MAKQRQRKKSRGRRAVTRPPRRRRLWLGGVVVLLLGIGTLLWSPWSRQGTVPPHAIMAAEQSALAPPFTLPSTAGEPLELAAYLGKQSVVLVFYMGDF